MISLIQRNPHTGGHELKKPKKKSVTKSKKNDYGRIKQDIFALILLSVSVMIFFSVVFRPGTIGIFGDFVRDIFLGLFGKFSAILVPLTFIIFSFLLLINKITASPFSVFIKLMLLYMFIAALINVSIYNKYEFYIHDFFGRITLYYNLGRQGIGGGALGAVICVPLIEYLRILGSVVVITTLAVIDLIIITNISVSENFQKLILLIKNLFKPKNRHKKNLITVKEPEKSKDKKKKDRKEKNQKKEFDLSELKITKPPDAPKPIKNSVKIKVPVKQDMDKTVVTKAVIPKKSNGYVKPPLYLLKGSFGERNQTTDLKKIALQRADILIETLKSFNVEAEIVNISIGPNITQFELSPKRGVKVSKIVNLADDIALNLAAADVRIEAPIPGKAAIGIEVPNDNINMVHLRDIIESREFKNNDSKLTFALGKDISGTPITADISRMPHLLIAGATGSGKSVCINNLILSILFNATPDEVRMILIDPKVVELKVYDSIPHLLIPVVTDPRKAAGALVWGVTEMNRRYNMFADNSVKDFKSYNKVAQDYNFGKPEIEKEKLPLIVIIIDELADLMSVAPNEVEDSICRLAQMARAAGIHLVLATQRPSVNVITGLIKANIPSRISFAVSAQVDSRTILDMNGAEKLIGKGDMLYLPIGMQKPKRLQGAYVSDKEVEAVVDFLKSHKDVEYDDDVFEMIEKGEFEKDARGTKGNDADEFLSDAIRIVVETGNASASLLQRKLKIGYARAGRIVDQMAEREIVGPYAGSKPREVLISKEEFYEMEMKSKKH